MWSKIMIRGLVLIEGSFPVASLNPNLHHVVHYGGQTFIAGLLRWIAMWCFERNNKRIKDMVRNVGKPVASLAQALNMDIATRIAAFENGNFDEPAAARPCSKLSVYHLSRRERIDLRILGVTSLRNAVHSFKIAHIGGEEFKGGEWGHKRCRSVVTTIYGGRSRYCYVDTFLEVEEKLYACVNWLSVPTYPYAPNLLVVRVKTLTAAEQLTYRCVIPVDNIEPCSVAVMPDYDSDDVHYFMMRSAGCDRVRVPPF